MIQPSPLKTALLLTIVALLLLTSCAPQPEPKMESKAGLNYSLKSIDVERYCHQYDPSSCPVWDVCSVGPSCPICADIGCHSKEDQERMFENYEEGRSLYLNKSIIRQEPSNFASDFALNMYSELSSKEGNIFFSPWSISNAFAMLYEGSQGNTREQMRQVFHFSENDTQRRNLYSSFITAANEGDHEYQIKIGNALWLQKDFPIIQDYLNTIQTHYGGLARNVDFRSQTEQARNEINKWINETTNGKIPELFSQGALNSDSRFVLTNAIYFKGDWQSAFDKADTREQPFKMSDSKSVNVPMMRQYIEDAPYAETDNLQILELPYKGREISMLILLPKNNDIKDLESGLSAQKLAYWRAILNDDGDDKESNVNVWLPKFKITKDVQLGDSLKKLGMPDAFSPQANFLGITSAPIQISEAIHKAYVDVNEEGTEAAAATGIEMDIQSVPYAHSFIADHPFIFLIKENNSGNILFMGRVVNPAEAT